MSDTEDKREFILYNPDNCISDGVPENVKTLLKPLLVIPPDFSKVEELLKTGEYSDEDISRTGYEYADICFDETMDYRNDDE